MSDPRSTGPATAVLPRIVDDAAPPPPEPDETAVEAPEPPDPAATPATPVSPGTGTHGPVRGSILTSWLVNAARVCGEFASLSVTAEIRAAVVVVPDLLAYLRWCGHLGIPVARRVQHADALGSYHQGTTTAHGWVLTVHLTDPPQENP